MPKIIENIQEKLLEEARHQLKTVGYSGVTIRSVAKACGVATGTVYNYFPSKEALIATHLLEDWNVCISTIAEAAARAQVPEPVVRCMYTQLVAFADRHQSIFRDKAAAAGFAGSFGPYHSLLRSQLAAPLEKFCSSDFTPQFIAESLLTWSMAGNTFEEIYEILKKLFKE